MRNLLNLLTFKKPASKKLASKKPTISLIKETNELGMCYFYLNRDGWCIQAFTEDEEAEAIKAFNIASKGRRVITLIKTTNDI